MFKENFFEYKKSIEKFFKKKNVRYGLPFILFCVCASFAMTSVTEVRYKYRAVKTVREEAKNEGLELKKPEETTIEAQYEIIKKEIDIDNWENKRIERPWEENDENAEKK
ncbi:cytochrome c oxidase assembly protein COX16 homolog, mitochondrial [Microplitis mediator]|uniref:cytochrome c oxidase assembly protein COX16 homolog, mitochondrial n=1 Tax=Microplitis mediator TaxID=375433 RepID=UPI002557618E|nr:cytochrome c oxidase assembly protein COX16 homolog, mitochondrial [Microplitis mediator]